MLSKILRLVFYEDQGVNVKDPMSSFDLFIFLPVCTLNKL